MTKLLGCSLKGGISSEQLPALLSQLSPGLNVDENVVSKIISQNNPTGNSFKLFCKLQVKELAGNNANPSTAYILLAFYFLHVLCLRLQLIFGVNK